MRMKQVERARRALGRRAWRLESQVRARVRAPKRVRCPICGWDGPAFLPSPRPRRPNRICPGCESSERYRALELTLRSTGKVEPGTRLLEVAPIDTLASTARDLGYDYASIDLKSLKAMVHGDLCALPFADGAFDTVVCFHVLEHVPNDRAAVAELARVVGPRGRVIVIVPRDESRATTFEVPDADPADYEALYGQSDHVRIYGADIAERWDLPGVCLDVQPWTELFTTSESRTAALPGDDDRYWYLRLSSAEPEPGSEETPERRVHR